MPKRGTRLFLCIGIVSLPAAASPQGDPLGPEFRVNTYTTNAQRGPSIAADSSGNVVVVWAAWSQDGSQYGVFGQRYASTGTPLGLEFRVNSYTTEFQYRPSVAARSSGDFVVVWHSLCQDGSQYGVFGQRYASTGATLGPEFRVNTYTTGFQDNPSVAADSSGNFVVVWQSQDDFFDGVFGQRYASSGAPIGPEFRVNTYTTLTQGVPSIAVDPAGNFVVVWQSLGQDGSDSGVFGQRYASSGAPIGPEFRVNTYTTSSQAFPSIAADSSGNFVVVWQSYGEDGSSGGVFGQRYGSAGTSIGSEFRVNTYTTFGQGDPSIAADPAGNFVVIWGGAEQDGSNVGVFGQRYANAGIPLGPEYRVNTYTILAQVGSSVAADPSGNFVVVWYSNGQDGSGYGVFGQRYNMIVPVELMRFGVE